MEIQNRQQEELLIFHQQFLASPIASQIRKLLDSHQQNIINAIAMQSKDVSNTTDQQIRHYGIQLNETLKITKMILDTETFITKSNNL